MAPSSAVDFKRDILPGLQRIPVKAIAEPVDEYDIELAIWSKLGGDSG